MDSKNNNAGLTQEQADQAKLVAQIKEYLWQKLIVVRAAPNAAPDEDYLPIFPLCGGETEADIEEYNSKMEQIIARGIKHVSVQNGMELKELASETVDTIIDLLLEPLYKRVDDGLAKKESRIVLPNSKERQQHGN